jgi:hypothetical protein
MPARPNVEPLNRGPVMGVLIADDCDQLPDSLGLGAHNAPFSFMRAVKAKVTNWRTKTLTARTAGSCGPIRTDRPPRPMRPAGALSGE